MLRRQEDETPAGSLPRRAFASSGALVAYAYEEPRLIAELLEASRPDLKSVAGGMIEASPAWARMKAAANAGAMDPRADISANLFAAADLVRRARRDDVPVASLLGQGDLIDALDPKTLAMLRVFYTDDAYTRARSADIIARELSFYADEARKTEAGPALFDDSDPAGRILAAIANGDDRRSRGSFTRNFDADDDAARLFDELAGGGTRASQDAGGTPSLARNSGDATPASIRSAISTPVAGAQALPFQSSTSIPPSAFSTALTAPPSSRLGLKNQSGKLAMHASDDLDALYRALGEKVDNIEKDLLALTETIDGAEFAGLRLKERARVDEKLRRRAASEIGDILGGRVILDSNAAPHSRKPFR